jgi:hypothetical protein
MDLVNHDLRPQFVEAGLVVGKNGQALRWHTPNDASGGALPDSRALWEFFRDNWKDIQGFAHTHPEGFSGPSWTDITTFAAIELGLDLRFDWWIVTKKITVVRWDGPGVHGYKVELLTSEPTWAGELRQRSRRTQVTA